MQSSLSDLSQGGIDRTRFEKKGKPHTITRHIANEEVVGKRFLRFMIHIIAWNIFFLYESLERKKKIRNCKIAATMYIPAIRLLL